MNTYLFTCIKSIVSFIVLLFLTRLMGRKQLSQITFFDYIVGITIGSIIASICVDRTINIYDGIISVLIWAAAPILVGYLSLKNIHFRQIADGERLVIIENGIVNDKNMAKAKYNIEDLLMQLRLKDVFDLSEVQTAVLEANGHLSVLKKPQFNSVTTKDMNIKTKANGLMTELILDGKILYNHLEARNLTEKWLLSKLKSNHIKSINDIIFAGYKTNGEVYFILKNNLKKNNISVNT